MEFSRPGQGRNFEFISGTKVNLMSNPCRCQVRVTPGFSETYAMYSTSEMSREEAEALDSRLGYQANNIRLEAERLSLIGEVPKLVFVRGECFQQVLVCLKLIVSHISELTSLLSLSGSKVCYNYGSTWTFHLTVSAIYLTS